MTRKRGRIARSQIGSDQTRQSDQLTADERDTGDATEDTETLHILKEELEGEGTTEGGDRSDSALQDTRDFAREVHAERDAAMARDQAEVKEYAGDLDERSDRDQSDLSRIEAADAQLRVGDSKAELAKMRDALGEDKDYLDEKAQEFRRRGEESERIAEEFRRRAQNASS